MANEDAGRKRRRVLQSLGALGVPKRKLATIIQQLEEQDVATSTARQGVGAAVAEHGRSETPYGRVLKVVRVESSRGPLDLPYICPQAMLFLACSLSTAFADALYEAVRGKRARIIVTVDELVPGNALRPDKGRTVQACYWSFLDLPDHIRSRSASWFTLFSIRSSIINDVRGKLSGFLAALLRAAFCCTHSLVHPGVHLPRAGGRFHVHAELTGFVADEKALKQVFQCKGASGCKPCMHCKNVVVSRAADAAAVEIDPYCKDLRTSQVRELDVHTDSSVYELVDMLRDRQPNMPVGQFKLLERALGFVHDPDSLLYQQDLRGLVRPSTGLAAPITKHV